jgi:hypothetical protein
MTGPRVSFTLARIDDFGKVRSEHVILVREQDGQAESLHRWHLSLGVAGSEQNYNELSSSTHLVETSLLGLASETYSLSPNWIANVSGELTLIPLSNSLTDVPSARFFNVDAKLGYKLPLSPLWLEMGWYAWGMLVPSGNYGVAYLGGPELFLFSTFDWIRLHPLWIYAKYASIETGLTVFSSTNRELSVGVLFALTGNKSNSHPIQLELTYTTSSYADSVNQFNFSQTSLGIRFGL